MPRLVDGQFPDTRDEQRLLPIELLKQKPPADFAIDEERRLLFVAMTRAKSRAAAHRAPARSITRSNQAASSVSWSAAVGDEPVSSDEYVRVVPTDVRVEHRASRPEADVEEAASFGGGERAGDDGSAAEDDARAARPRASLRSAPPRGRDHGHARGTRCGRSCG